MKFDLKFLRDFSFFEIAEEICLSIGLKKLLTYEHHAGGGDGGLDRSFFPTKITKAP